MPRSATLHLPMFFLQKNLLFLYNYMYTYLPCNYKDTYQRNKIWNTSILGVIQDIFLWCFSTLNINVYIPWSQTIKELDGIKNVILNIADLIVDHQMLHFCIWQKTVKMWVKSAIQWKKCHDKGMGGFLIFSMEYI